MNISSPEQMRWNNETWFWIWRFHIQNPTWHSPRVPRIRSKAARFRSSTWIVCWWLGHPTSPHTEVIKSYENLWKVVGNHRHRRGRPPPPRAHHHHHQSSSIINHQSSITNHQSSIIINLWLNQFQPKSRQKVIEQYWESSAETNRCWKQRRWAHQPVWVSSYYEYPVRKIHKIKPLVIAHDKAFLQKVIRFQFRFWLEIEEIRLQSARCGWLDCDQSEFVWLQCLRREPKIVHSRVFLLANQIVRTQRPNVVGKHLRTINQVEFKKLWIPFSSELPSEKMWTCKSI